jgi:hypothetical protein
MALAQIAGYQIVRLHEKGLFAYLRVVGKLPALS